jgi:hypothetical protein
LIASHCASESKKRQTHRRRSQTHHYRQNQSRIKIPSRPPSTASPDGWLKLTPTEDLAPGEYAIVAMHGSEGMNLYLWPFSVNPNAPANANPWMPDVKEDKAADLQKSK